jgi:hypothetical protein
LPVRFFKKQSVRDLCGRRRTLADFSRIFDVQPAFRQRLVRFYARYPQTEPILSMISKNSYAALACFKRFYAGFARGWRRGAWLARGAFITALGQRTTRLPAPTPFSGPTTGNGRFDCQRTQVRTLFGKQTFGRHAGILPFLSAEALA